MNKPWVGYISAGLLLMAGILMIAGQKPVIGCLFILLAIASVFLNVMMYRKK